MIKLPTATIARWTPKAKAAIVAAINAGQITVTETLATYAATGLTGEELGIWLRNERLGGRAALRVTRVQHYADALGCYA